MAAKFDIGNLIYKTTDDTNIKLWKKTPDEYVWRPICIIVLSWAYFSLIEKTLRILPENEIKIDIFKVFFAKTDRWHLQNKLCFVSSNWPKGISEKSEIINHKKYSNETAGAGLAIK